MDDLDNAKAAYERSMQLDQKDPAIPLNYAALLYGQCKDNLGAGSQLKVVEERVAKIRETPGLDADPDVR